MSRGMKQGIGLLIALAIILVGFLIVRELQHQSDRRATIRAQEQQQEQARQEQEAEQRQLEEQAFQEQARQEEQARGEEQARREERRQQRHDEQPCDGCQWRAETDTTFGGWFYPTNSDPLASDPYGPDAVTPATFDRKHYPTKRDCGQ